jgi:hypothetical protein
MKQGREASGRHGSRRIPQGSERAANAARTVERGKNPEDGTGEGLATLAYHDGGASFRRGTKVAPGVKVLSGARTPGEADPVPTDRGRPRKRASMRTGGGQSRRGRALKRSRTSREGLADVHARRSVSPRKTPEPLERQGGSAGSHEGATRRSRTPLKKTATSRELGRGRVTAHDHRVSRCEPLEGQAKRTATRRHPPPRSPERPAGAGRPA